MIGLAVVLGIIVTHLLLRQLLVREALAEEAEYFWQVVNENPQAALPATKNLRAYLLPRDGDLLPESAHHLTLGYHEYHHVEKFNVAYLSEDNNGLQLLILFNRSGVDSLVLLFGILPLSVALIFLYISLYISYRFSLKLLSPAKYLADKIRQSDLRTIGKKDFINEVDAKKYDSETATIAEAIGELAQRVHLFIERESNFTRDVSHELRSPITVTKLASELLSTKDLSPDLAPVVKKISHAANDMEELTEFFLHLAREESSREFEQTIDVNAIAEQEIDKLAFMIDDSHVTMVLDNQKKCYIKGSEQVLSVLCGNLLRNAILYTKKGSVTVTVDSDKIIVKDTGVGISQDKMSTIFECFERDIAQTKANRPKGYGVGLSIVKRLCDRYGWQIDLKSEKDKGTTATVYFNESRV